VGKFFYLRIELTEEMNDDWDPKRGDVIVFDDPRELTVVKVGRLDFTSVPTVTLRDLKGETLDDEG